MKARSPVVRMSFWLVLTVIASLGVLAQARRPQAPRHAVVRAEDGKLHGMGLIYQDPRTIPGWHELSTKALAEAAPAQPSSVINTAYLPPVGDQGVQGSCVAWAAGYYTMTYMEAKAHNWTPTSASQIMSPAYIYDQDHFVPDSGSYPSDATQLLSTLGCATLDQMPYTDQSDTAWPSESAYKEAMSYRVLPNSVTWVSTTQPGGLDAVKQWLAQGNIGFAAINVYNNFMYISSYNDNYCLADVTGNNVGGHGTTIIGYDDNHVTDDGVGAFRCVNSWGTGWGDQGYYWLSYQAVTDSNNTIFQGYVTYFQVKSGSPSYAAVFQINYPQFRDLALTLNNGSATIPLWHLFSWADPSSRNLGLSAPPNPVWVDISDLAAPSGQGSFSLSVTNGYNGTQVGQITSFAVVNLWTGQSTASLAPPVSILPPGPPVLLPNGGFESGLTDWTPSQSGGGAPPVASSSQAHSGAYSAYLFAGEGGGAQGWAELGQSFAVPTTPTSLLFWCYPLLQGTSPDDSQAAVLANNQGNVLAWAMFEDSNGQAWTPVYCDLSSYAGRTIAAWFWVYHDGTPNASVSMYVDDVGLCPEYPAVATVTLCPAIALSPSSLSNGTVGTAYSQTISASGGAGPYAFAVTSGNLPEGLALSSGGYLSGTPSAAGTSAFTVTATDANGCTGSANYTVAVVVQPPVVISVTKLTAPFRLNIRGSNLQPGIQVFIAGTRWTNLAPKSSAHLVIKGGASLKALFPVSVSVPIELVNPDGGTVTVNWTR
ncbi:MAG: putative Ig domain-containing protein [Acidobacteriota bacterium]